MPEHRAECRFGPGFYRIVLSNGTRRFCQTEKDVRVALSLLVGEEVRHIQRDACLDEPDTGDANTPDVVDAARWLALERDVAMRELGIDSETDYVRAYRAVEEAVIARDRAASLGGVRPTVVIKRRGAAVTNV